MNKQPIEMAKDADLRLSPAAMHRAAQRAHELALKTSTAIVISRHGVVELFDPSATQTTQPQVVREPPTPYSEKP
jgi:hypothetical protein